jgi:chromosome segregation ATPase
MDEIISNLQIANQNAISVIENNKKFHEELQRSLGSISDQIEQIDAKIRELTQKLEALQNQIQTNEGIIASNEEEKRRLEQQSMEAENKRLETARELANNEAERLRLQEDLARQQRDNAEELKMLNERLEREKTELQGASERERQQLQQEIERTKEEISALNEDNKSAALRSKEELQILNQEREKLKQELNDSKVEVEKITEESKTLELNSAQLREENAKLNSTLAIAKEQMTHAIENLNALSNEQEHGNINNLVTRINEQLKEINKLLGIQEGRPIDVYVVEGESNNIPFQSQTGTRENQQRVRGPIVDINDIIMFNGAQKPIKEIIEFLQVKNNQIKRNNPNNKFKIALEYINNALTSQEIQSYLQLDTYKGGRKTRKAIKNKRKTRKIRKQKGGYYYNQNSKRKSITTTSRKTSKRTRRTLSL